MHKRKVPIRVLSVLMTLAISSALATPAVPVISADAFRSQSDEPPVTISVDALMPAPPWRNDELATATAGFDADSYQRQDPQTLAEKGSQMALSAQNRGTLLYASSDIEIFSRANYRYREKRPGSNTYRTRFGGIEPYCRASDWKLSKNGQRATVRLKVMRLSVVINKPREFEISTEWIWNNLRDVIRDEVATRYCGGDVEVVDVQIWYAGLQHTIAGDIIQIEQYEYPLLTIGDEIDNAVFAIRGPDKEFHYLAPFEAGFASASFYYWEHFRDKSKATLRQLGYANERGLAFTPVSAIALPQGSYRETFTAMIAAGRARYSKEAKIVELYPHWENLSYEAFARQIWLQNYRDDAVAAYHARKEQDLYDLVKAIMVIQRNNFCLGYDTPWWAWGVYNVRERRDREMCEPFVFR